MRIAILSDIHGNLEALEAVLSDLQMQQVDQVVCLGDLVGYGPDPEAVVRRVGELGYVSILGNHEAALFSRKDRTWMNFQARENNISTQQLLSQASLDYCTTLPRSAVLAGGRFVHGCPPESVLKYLYMLTDEEVCRILADLAENICFVGHTHELALLEVDGEQVTRLPFKAGLHVLDSSKKYMANVGSVGQPRDGNSKAKYVIWDSDQATLEVVALTYPKDVTAEKIVARGFPKAYATRL